MIYEAKENDDGSAQGTGAEDSFTYHLCLPTQQATTSPSCSMAGTALQIETPVLTTPTGQTPVEKQAWLGAGSCLTGTAPGDQECGLSGSARAAEAKSSARRSG